jgi:hypothetical protein
VPWQASNPQINNGKVAILEESHAKAVIATSKTLTQAAAGRLSTAAGGKLVARIFDVDPLWQPP